MKTFLLGAVIGGLIVWRWRDDIQGYIEDGRARARLNVSKRCSREQRTR
jgi:hypothetical protein